MSGYTPFSETKAFARDVLIAIAAHEGAHGAELISYFEEVYGEPITDARFYMTVSQLVDRDWVRKETEGGRNKAYFLTNDGREAVRTDLDWRTSALE